MVHQHAAGLAALHVQLMRCWQHQNGHLCWTQLQLLLLRMLQPCQPLLIATKGLCGTPAS